MKNNVLGKVWKRLLNILFWSIISAAFIGPGTVTTATKAGSDFQFQLLWALSFSTMACLVLQEASARSTIYSGLNLGQAIKYHYMGKKAQIPVLVLIVGAIILGCAAYEAGNILGSVAGLTLVFPNLDERIIVGAIAVIAGLALSLKSIRSIANFMGCFVFIMGFTFITTAVVSDPPLEEIAKGLVVPSIPDSPGAGLLVLGLVGTTVVPYDIFLGSSVVQKDTTVKDMRIGISVAVILGGFISMAILCVGSEMTRDYTPEALKELGGFSYKLLSNTLMVDIGPWAVYIFGFGMFAAGFTSAITSPLASSLTARSIFEKKDADGNSKNGKWFHVIAYVVLAFGVILGFFQKKPVPVIVAAQAFNGLILPFVAIFLLMVVNDPRIMGKEHINGLFSNICMVVVTWVTLILGTVQVTKAALSVVEDASFSPDALFMIATVFSLVVTVLISWRIFNRRRKVLALIEQEPVSSDTVA
ncbi:MAG: divalent metal cation transporter [Bacteroidales bacterium]|nr:divalent metal cation transporter [Bacteroidales bacterium]